MARKITTDATVTIEVHGVTISTTVEVAGDHIDRKAKMALASMILLEKALSAAKKLNEV